ncbi:MAG: DUF58 domain-containing protein [Thermodesulfovibrionia bacterium]|nr:DUF58 domain-containing protein [Thermodesulfovibrionia bacterium]
MVISGLLGKANITGIDIELEPSLEVYANRPFPLKIRNINKRRYLPGFMFRVHVAGESVFLPFISVKSESSAYVNFTFEARGRQVIDDLYLCSAFPFNFFVRCRKIKKSFDFIVFPEPKRCELLSHVEEKVRRSGELPVNKAGFYPEMISIRDYISGDPLRYINWKATAKTDKLQTKELSSASFNPVVIDFDAIEMKILEEKISCITYAVLQLHNKGVPFGFKIRDKIYLPETTNYHKYTVLNELALYGAADES